MLDMASPVAILATTAGTSRLPLITSGGSSKFSLWGLFQQSADLFTVLLLGASIVAASIIVRCLLLVRERAICPPDVEALMRKLIAGGRFAELRRLVDEDDSLLSRSVRAAMLHPADDRTAMREAAEMAASEDCARWFRTVEPLQLVGNLGPLLGLAGTVWGMIIAFASLGATQGRAGPADLSLGISKALFHTLLGLMLAVPALTSFGLFRGRVDRLCTRAMTAAAEIVELLPTTPAVRIVETSAPGAPPSPARPSGPTFTPAFQQPENRPQA
jgi:biopolymer transport protein ExbB